jgi:N-acetylglucosaminyldiphosphoundecaprenol N-acetyl-beta-D-mannosaminyltransferase
LAESVVKRFSVLGVGISAINMQQALLTMDSWIKTRAPHYVCVTPAHSVMACYDDPDLRKIYNASGLCTPDGMPMVWLAHWAGYREVERVYGPDLLLAACQHSLDHGYSHYFFGGADEVTKKLVESLQTRFPGLQVAGWESPPFRPLTAEEEQGAIQRIRTARPDFLWVSLGSPRQESWLARYHKEIEVPVQIGVGAAFDFLSGFKPQAPRWIQRSGFEWLYRLFSEPGRLWRRYLMNYPRFIILVLMQLSGLKSFPIETQE